MKIKNQFQILLKNKFNYRKKKNNNKYNVYNYQHILNLDIKQFSLLNYFLININYQYLILFSYSTFSFLKADTDNVT